MTEKTKLQYIKLEDPEDVVCPVCGQTVFHPTEDFYDLDPCPHFLFWYVGYEYPGYEYWTDEFEKRFCELEKKLEPEDKTPDDMTWEEQLPAMGYDPEDLVIVKYGSSGIACGPVSFDTWYGFDRSAGKKKSEQ